MLEPIFNFIENVWEWLLPCTILDANEGGIMLRLGKYHKTLGSGFHWKLPLGIDEAVTLATVWTQINVPCQTLTTKDGKTINSSYTVEYRVTDPAKVILQLYDIREKINQAVVGLLAQQIFENTWEECLELDLSGSVRDELQTVMSAYGVEVSATGGAFRDFSQGRSIRHFQEHLDHNPSNAEDS